MEISLPPSMERYIQTKIDSGAYLTPGDVVKQALKTIQIIEKDTPPTNKKDFRQYFGALKGKLPDGLEFVQKIRRECE